MRRKLPAASALLICLALCCDYVARRPASAQDGAQERDIEAKEAVQGRREGKNSRPGQGGRYRPEAAAQRRGRKTAARQFPTGPPPQGTTYMTVGVTLWRVHRATEAERKDPGVRKERMRLSRQEPDAEVVVERISDNTPITKQDFIQIGIEYLPYRHTTGRYLSERICYLYVVNREQFPDGSLKNARLIFPTSVTYDGDNRLMAGRTVMLPDPRRPFRITSSTSGQAQAYETYTIIISPAPLDAELPRELSAQAMDLSPELPAKWERQWGAGEARADLRGGLSAKRTAREIVSSGDPSAGERGTVDSEADLTQDDPLPQIVFRKVVRPGTPMMVTIKVPFKEIAATAAAVKP